MKTLKELMHEKFMERCDVLFNTSPTDMKRHLGPQFDFSGIDQPTRENMRFFVAITRPKINEEKE